jgi:hypothetical protein
MTYALTQETITKILNYLSTRPWIEAHQLIVEITNSVNKDKEIRDGDSTKPRES